MVSHGDLRLSLYAPCRVCGGTYEPKASLTGGPPVTGFAPPRDHGAAVEALHASGLVYRPCRHGSSSWATSRV